MSRIDEALRISEDGGIASAEVIHFQPGDFPALSQYAREHVERHVPDEPVSAGSTEPVKRAAPALRADADLQVRLVTGTPSTVSVEQYRKLGAVLHQAQVQNQTKTVMITSALPHEGKTLTVINLALTLSESFGRRVLVVDADLRCPSLHTILNITNDRGLGEALLDGQHDLPFAQVSARLSALTAGNSAATPLAGLSSQRMREVLDKCAARFDWVLIDTPPVGVLTDAQVVARLVGEVILVIGAGSTPAAAIERAVAELGGPDAITGTVLNRVKERHIADAGYYHSYGASGARRF